MAQITDQGPPVIIRQVMLKSCKKEPGYCSLSEKQNPCPPPEHKHITTLSTAYTWGSPQCYGVSRGHIYATIP